MYVQYMTCSYQYPAKVHDLMQYPAVVHDLFLLVPN